MKAPIAQTGVSLKTTKQYLLFVQSKTPGCVNPEKPYGISVNGDHISVSVFGDHKRVCVCSCVVEELWVETSSKITSSKLGVDFKAYYLLDYAARKRARFLARYGFLMACS
jgi:hypothetical protein